MFFDLIKSPYELFFFFFFNDTATTEIYTLSLHDALPIFRAPGMDRHRRLRAVRLAVRYPVPGRSEEHTSELQSRLHLVCRLLLEKKKKKRQRPMVLILNKTCRILRPTLPPQCLDLVYGIL